MFQINIRRLISLVELQLNFVRVDFMFSFFMNEFHVYCMLYTWNDMYSLNRCNSTATALFNMLWTATTITKRNNACSYTPNTTNTNKKLTHSLIHTHNAYQFYKLHTRIFFVSPIIPIMNWGAIMYKLSNDFLHIRLFAQIIIPLVSA